MCKDEEKKNKDIRDQAQFKLLCAKDNWQMFDKDFIDDALKIYNICLKRILISNWSINCGKQSQFVSSEREKNKCVSIVISYFIFLFWT